MQHIFDLFLSAATRQPLIALAMIGLVAFAESLAIVGTVVPAALVMFAGGVLVGHGALPLVWTLAVATTGAIAGDAISYELGRRHQARVRRWTIFGIHASRIASAEAFIARHGAFSVVIARFTGAVRAFVPLLCGLAKMARLKFYATNVVSAMLWAPVHILPGVVFGASLKLAEAASGRLALLALVLTAVLWLAVWVVSLAVRTVAPIARRLRVRAFDFINARQGPVAGFVRQLVDPGSKESTALLAAFAVLLASMWLFFGVLEDVLSRDPLVNVDRAVFTFLQQLRTEPVDRIMVRITELGSIGVVLPLTLAVAGWLAWRRCWRTAGYWLVTAASAELIVQILKVTLGRHRPASLYEGIEQFSFPSGHATMSVVVIVNLAVLVGRRQSIAWRVGVGTVTAVYVVMVGFSRLYLGAHWLSDVLGGCAFGLASVALSAIVYTQHRVREDIAERQLALGSIVAIGIFAVAWMSWRAPIDMARYASRPAMQLTSLDAWRQGGYLLLPDHRRELAGEQREPLTVQIACSQPALQDAVARAGWSAAPSLSIRAALLALSPAPSLTDLPVLPKFDAGRASEVNLFGRSTGGPKSRTVLRLWRSEWNVSASSGGVPIWYGALYSQFQVRSDVGWLRERAEPEASVDVIGADGLRRWQVVRPNGSTLTLWSCM